jgi:hypothetical protein
MKTFVPKEKKGLTVGEIVDAMHKSGDFVPYGREDIFVVVEIFLKEYVGMPGTLKTRKFSQDDAHVISERVNIPYEMVVRIISVFRLAAGKKSDAKQKLMKLYNKVRIKGGTKHGVTSRM